MTLVFEDMDFTMSNACLVDLLSGLQYEVDERDLDDVFNLDIHIYVNDQGRFETRVKYTEARE